MKSVLTTPNATLVVSYSQLAARLSYTNPAKRADIELLLAGCQAFAELEMNCSLLTQVWTATGYDNEPINLDHGPIQSVLTVSNDGVAVTDYRLKAHGSLDELVIPAGYGKVLTVTYRTGYGDAPDSVPANIRNTIMAHAIEQFKNPGVEDEKLLDRLRNFYRLNARRAAVA